MAPRSRSSGARWWLAVVAVGAAGLAGGRAEAQFWGPWGGGFFGPQYSPTAQYLNQRSLVQAQAAYANAPGPLVNPHAQTSSGRDYDYYEKYDVATRHRIEQRVLRSPPPMPARSPGEGGTAKAAAPATPPVPAVPALASYFLKDKLQWPADAPASGELALKRTECDDAVTRVLKESRAQGFATIASANDARTKLLEYGRPALKQVRAQSSRGVADAFNNFLLSLYDSIGHAATPRTS